MKKIFLLIFIIFNFLNYNFSEARNVYEKELPEKFMKECFKNLGSYIFTNKNQGKNIIKFNKDNIIAVKEGYLIPIIPYVNLTDKKDYSSSVFTKNNFLNDDNENTFLEIDTEKDKEIILEFAEKLEKSTFKLNFIHSSELYETKFFISEDGKKYSNVKKSQISDFSIKKIKIVFESKSKEIIREVIKIKELSFSEIENINLIRVDGGGKVYFYSDYDCLDSINLDTIPIGFEIDINTPRIEVELEENPYYNPNIEKDVDGDKIENFEDNCPNVDNPLQIDSDGDGIGDECSDVDGDLVVGYLDNCPKISNPDQKDINLNNIGDICEFDKDEDGISDGIDNCITTKNALQLDDDKDGIGNKCDNCEFFNPDQKDDDENNIGDICDINVKRLESNDDDKDGIINSKDNCIDIVNKDQKDFDKDGIGDLCDNCIKIQNNNQLDFDKNKIGDICEDSDKDGIEGIKDNCLNVANTDQKDDDNNGIGNLCEDTDFDEVLFVNDNCPYKYNPIQKDIDKDGIGDVCDNKDDRILESNKNLFILILVLITGIFFIGIFFMIKKISNVEKDENNIGNFKIKELEKLDKKFDKRFKKQKGDIFIDGESYTKSKKNSL